MKRLIILLSLAIFSVIDVLAWSPKGDHIMTRWGKSLTPETTWQRYPRPQLQRNDWQNLNGLWSCSVTSHDASLKSVAFDKEILVPFCIESSLSGLAEKFTPEDILWYKRTFSLDKSWKGKDIILHFGAVDYSCEVLVNGKSVGTHKGGNNSFSMNITEYVKFNGDNTLIVSVTDPTDAESDTRGKQILNPKGIWYTAVSGIWKTVWLEPVRKTHIESIVPMSDIKEGKVFFDAELASAKGGETLMIEVLDGNKIAGTYEGDAANAAVTLKDPVLWSPDNPKLYSVKAVLKRGGKVLDEVNSYCALRKVSKIKDELGVSRIALNDEPIFQLGPLDQGWWPDGLLTPPSEEAMLFDMVELKKMGFNTIRKHIKVEPELYYYFADSLGIMIWQDMPSGFQTSKASEQHVSAQSSEDWNAPEAHVEQWKYEYKEMYHNLRFFPCITTWVVFNEGWGQFRTAEMTAFAKELDDTRLINGVTGWADRGVGDIYDIHNYPSTSMKLPSECNGRISALGEFGGLGYPVKDHLWDASKGWGYRNMDANLELMNNYSRLMYDLEGLASQGLSAAIYTQTTDVETELNGLMTYDREVVKLNESMLNILHDRVYKAVPARINILVDRSEKERSVIGPGESSVYSQTFNFDGNTEKFGLWINCNAIVKVNLNGQDIFAGQVRQTRNYNHFNISNYSRIFIKGENKITFEMKNEQPKKETKFDFMITTY